MKAPPRVLDDASVPASLRADLERSLSVVEPYDAAAGLAGLQAAIGSLGSGAGADAGTAGTGAADAAASAGTGIEAAGSAQSGAGALVAKATAWLGTPLAKIMVAAVGAAVVAASVASLRTSAPAGPAPARAPQLPLVTAPATPFEVESAPAAAQAEIDRAPGLPDTEAARREIAQVGRIKALLDADPAQAYRFAQAGHREFGQGLLHQEREGLAVLALFRMDRGDEATPRAQAFLARYPRSPLRAQVELRLQAERSDDR